MTTGNWVPFAVAMVLLPFAPGVQAQEAQPDAEPALDALALFELDQELKAETTVASARAKNIRDTPGVVTVVTREEIQQLGARDLMDVLRLVPGFAFGMDVEGVVGVGFRGAWGHEGKVLLMIDGQELNETLYSTLQFGNHYPLHDVQRVEIIRGPGSAIYGGTAELAVINVVTRSGAELNGAQVGVTYGRYPSAFARQNVHLSVGKDVGDFSFTGAALVGQGQRSDATYRDFYGTEYPLHGNARTDPTFINLGAKWRGLQVRYLHDDYSLTTRDGFDAAEDAAARMSFRQTVLDARYGLEVTDGLTVTPRLTWRRGQPWSDNDPSDPSHYQKLVDRYTARLTADWRVTDALHVVLGGELYEDRASVRGPETDFNAFFDGERSVRYQNRAVFAEVLFEHWLANVLAGARFEDHSEVGPSFVPRVALTRIIDRFHAKLLYSRAFRAPGIENIALGEDIRPERTGVLEAEAGYQLTDKLFLRANVFDVGITDPIVYFYDEETEAEGYTNYTRTGTRGVEAELRYRRRNAWAQLSYSLYRAHDNEVASYAVPDQPALLLALPAHKVTLVASVNPWANLHLTASGIFMSPRHGFLRGEEGESDVEASPPAVLVNAFATYKDLGVRGLELGVGVYDLLNQGTPLLQPYDGGHAPMPGPRREILGRLQYTYRFD